jgi:hypothetical protein
MYRITAKLPLVCAYYHAQAMPLPLRNIYDQKRVRPWHYTRLLPVGAFGPSLTQTSLRYISLVASLLPVNVTAQNSFLSLIFFWIFSL